MSTDIKDIGEFLYQQKVLFEMKGLSGSPEIHEYMVNKTKRELSYHDTVYDE